MQRLIVSRATSAPRALQRQPKGCIALQATIHANTTIDHLVVGKITWLHLNLMHMLVVLQVCLVLLCLHICGKCDS